MIIIKEIEKKYNNGERNVFNLTGPNSISEIISRLNFYQNIMIFIFYLEITCIKKVHRNYLLVVIVLLHTREPGSWK